MRITSIIAIYALFWSFSVFLVLPFRPHGGRPREAFVPGQAESAPDRFSVRQTAKWTTIVATALFALFYVNYVEGWFGAEMFDLFQHAYYGK